MLTSATSWAFRNAQNPGVRDLAVPLLRLDGASLDHVRGRQDEALAAQEEPAAEALIVLQDHRGVGGLFERRGQLAILGRAGAKPSQGIARLLARRLVILRQQGPELLPLHQRVQRAKHQSFAGRGRIVGRKLPRQVARERAVDHLVASAVQDLPHDGDPAGFSVVQGFDR